MPWPGESFSTVVLDNLEPHRVPHRHTACLGEEEEEDRRRTRKGDPGVEGAVKAERVGAGDVCVALPPAAAASRLQVLRVRLLHVHRHDPVRKHLRVSPSLSPPVPHPPSASLPQCNARFTGINRNGRVGSDLCTANKIMKTATSAHARVGSDRLACRTRLHTLAHMLTHMLAYAFASSTVSCLTHDSLAANNRVYTAKGAERRKGRRRREARLGEDLVGRREELEHERVAARGREGRGQVPFHSQPSLLPPCARPGVCIQLCECVRYTYMHIC